MRPGIYQGYSVHNLTPRPFHVQEKEVTLGMRLASRSHSNVLQPIPYPPVVPPPKFSWEFELTLNCATLLSESCEREGMGGGRGGISSSKSSRSSANSGSSSPSISKKSG